MTRGRPRANSTMPKVPAALPADPVKRLVLVGVALYGPSWQGALAQAIGVARTTVVRWRAGKTEMPDDLDKRLVEAVTKRAAELMERSDVLVALASLLESLAEGRS